MMAAPVLANAQNSTAPANAIKIIVPFPPGGTVDPIARLVQPSLQTRLGTPVIVDNKTGASGSIGTDFVAKSPPDGTTWLFAYDTHGINPFLQKLPFDTEKDLVPVMVIGTTPNVLCAHPSRPYRTLQEVVAAAKQKPGALTYATGGNGGISHMTMVQLCKRAGIEMQHVPYRGAGPAMTDLLAGNVDFMMGTASLVTPHVKAEKIRPIFQTGKTKAPALTQVPTVAESGLGDFEAYSWWGVFGPKDTPAPVVARFADALAASLKEEATAQFLTEKLQISMILAGPDATRQFVRSQMDQWERVVRENNIKAD
jgi:tripartite-type tricarboxylate transporter receptor subunit TctC